MPKKVAYISLGCKLNFSETSWIVQQFENAGYERVDNHEQADVVVVDTCTVTELANKKSRQAIHKILNRAPETILVAIGCYTQLKPDEVAEIEGVDYIFGSDNKMDLTDIIGNLQKQPKPVISVSKESRVFEPIYSFGDRTRSFFKVQDGCDYFCAYCTIPHARGRSRSNTLAHTVEVAREAVARGIREIVLTGVNIGDFGRANGENLYQLLLELERIEGLKRLRISSIEPNLLTDQIIEHVVDSEVIMPHFHIPLQCGTDRLLALMHRRYTTSFYAKRIELIKNLIPDACIAADVITGVPTESDADFDEACNFIKSMPLSYLHVFPYSVRANTLAARMEMVPNEIRKHRCQDLIGIGKTMTKAFIDSQIGSTRPVLFEAEPFGKEMCGFTDNYIRVKTPANQAFINTVQNVRIDRYIGDNEATGTIIN
ncbi:MAG: tRNA (N(6)-L-threonylcarbamoyladenosine(37)-C(2))-methylthiotransferase MtaB [Salinivirgaceae bacterium]|nr:tRNA (N(6)-L-threonylcarbamoyladenosine(37)-C(2))-methylthiotransferase MtaB [Salinivirgaceae bacterium]